MPPELQVLVILIAFAGFWFIVLRPARNAQRRTIEVQDHLGVGEVVLLTSGIFGTITTLDEERIGLEVAPGTVITVARQAVLKRVDDQPGSKPRQLDEQQDKTEE